MDKHENDILPNGTKEFLILYFFLPIEEIIGKLNKYKNE